MVKRPMTDAQRRARNAEHQAAYRRRHLQAPDTVDSERINQVVGIGTKRALERLARHYAVSQRAALEKALGEADRAVTDGMSHKQYLHYVRDKD